MTVECAALQGGNCPDPTPAQMAGYTMPGYVNKIVIQTPELGPVKIYSHILKFFQDLNFAPGRYVFTVCVDAGKKIRESNEQDNCKRFSMVKKPVAKKCET